jgi:hypothetical protein
LFAAFTYARRQGIANSVLAQDMSVRASRCYSGHAHCDHEQKIASIVYIYGITHERLSTPDEGLGRAQETQGADNSLFLPDECVSVSSC